MKASKLIGKSVARTKPAIMVGSGLQRKDPSYMGGGVTLLEVQESGHIKYFNHTTKSVCVLPPEFNDDAWVKCPKEIHTPIKVYRLFGKIIAIY